VRVEKALSEGKIDREMPLLESLAVASQSVLAVGHDEIFIEKSVVLELCIVYNGIGRQKGVMLFKCKHT